MHRRCKDGLGARKWIDLDREMHEKRVGGHEPGWMGGRARTARAP